jgi:hypothetical protein
MKKPRKTVYPGWEKISRQQRRIAGEPPLIQISGRKQDEPAFLPKAHEEFYSLLL